MKLDIACETVPSLVGCWEPEISWGSLKFNLKDTQGGRHQQDVSNKYQNNPSEVNPFTKMQKIIKHLKKREHCHLSFIFSYNLFLPFINIILAGYNKNRKVLYF